MPMQRSTQRRTNCRRSNILAVSSIVHRRKRTRYGAWYVKTSIKGAARRQARRPARGAQGQYLSCRRADDDRRAIAGGLCARRRRHHRRAYPRCGRRDRRQSGLRILLRLRRQPYELDRTGAQSAQARLHHRRIVVGQRRTRRRRRRRHGDRRRSGRLDPHPGQPLRHRRSQADLRPRPLHRHRAAGDHDRYRRPDDRDVRDNALLLEVIAGPDGLDTRQRGVPAGRYTEALDGGVKGMRIAVVKEGFGHPNSEPDVDAHVRDAAQRFAKLGATVEEVSVPTHALGFPVWAAIRGDAACIMLLEMNGAGIGHEGPLRHQPARPRHGMAQARRRIRRHAEDRVDLQQIYHRPLRRTFLRQGAKSAPARARGLRRGIGQLRSSADADGADESDADPWQGCDTAGDHPAKLGADPQYLSDQRHRPPGDQHTVWNGGRPADRHDADRASLRRGHDLSGGRGVRARPATGRRSEPVWPSTHEA